MNADMALDDRASAVRQARTVTASVLARWHCTQDCVDDAVLIVSEMVTNAVRHGGGRVRLRLRRGAHVLRLEVRDGTRRLPRLLPAAPDAECGRGLRIVTELAYRWGTTRVRGGKIVWAEVVYRRVGRGLRGLGPGSAGLGVTGPLSCVGR
jgi:anti-sigma regulatory factor (Ser/Thr protein kinase)